MPEKNPGCVLRVPFPFLLEKEAANPVFFPIRHGKREGGPHPDIILWSASAMNWAEKTMDVAVPLSAPVVILGATVPRSRGRRVGFRERAGSPVFFPARNEVPGSIAKTRSRKQYVMEKGIKRTVPAVRRNGPEKRKKPGDGGSYWTCRFFACSSVSSMQCQGRPRLLSSSMNGSGSFCSMLKTPAPDHLPVRIISAPIMAGTPVV